MKHIFDFDDTLFKNTPDFKEHMFSTIAQSGISRETAEKQYRIDRVNEFSLMNFLRGFGREELYEKIMQKCGEFLNENILNEAKKAGRENCYLVSNGEKEFQMEKINRAGIVPLFREIHIVPRSKKEVIERICLENPSEEITFWENREIFIKDLDLKKCPNLKIRFLRN